MKAAWMRDGDLILAGDIDAEGRLFIRQAADETPNGFLIRTLWEARKLNKALGEGFTRVSGPMPQGRRNRP